LISGPLAWANNYCSPTGAMTEFDYLDLCFDKWVALLVTDLTRNQQIVVDVNSTLGMVSGNGFQNFWSAYEDESERIIESFRLANLSDLAESRFQ